MVSNTSRRLGTLGGLGVNVVAIFEPQDEQSMCKKHRGMYYLLPLSWIGIPTGKSQFLTGLGGYRDTGYHAQQSQETRRSGAIAATLITGSKGSPKHRGMYYLFLFELDWNSPSAESTPDGAARCGYRVTGYPPCVVSTFQETRRRLQRQHGNDPRPRNCRIHPRTRRTALSLAVGLGLLPRHWSPRLGWFY